MFTNTDTLRQQDFFTRKYVIAPRLSSGDRGRSRATAMRLLQSLDRNVEKEVRTDLAIGVVAIEEDDIGNWQREIEREVGQEIIITPQVKYSIARAPMFPTHVRQNSSLSSLSSQKLTRSIRLVVVDRLGNLVPGATVCAFISLRWGLGFKADTDKYGIAEIQVPLSDTPISEIFEVVYIYPAHSFWPTYRVQVPVADKTINLQSLPVVEGYQWWSKILGVNKAHSMGYEGQGVKIAVVDTGIGPHPDLDNVIDGRNFTIDQGVAAYEDVDGHGTHVAGIIGASGSLIGIAPKAEIYAARVFKGDNVFSEDDDNTSADSDDIAEAIEVSVDQWNCHIINLSLGGPYDPLIEDRINYAAQRGVLCVAAAGNSAGAIEYPAALRNSFCIAAVGRTDTYPKDSIHKEAEPESMGLYGKNNLYAAKFSCFGDEVAACAPEVAIISTVPHQSYAALDGTSMACPIAAGAAAILLSKDSSLLNTQGYDRVARLKAQIKAVLQDIRLPRKYQGGGIVNL